MGCGVSKLEIAEGEAAPPCNQLSPIHRRINDRAVVDSSLLPKSLPEGGEGHQEHAKGTDIQHKNIIKMVKSEDKEGIQKEGVEKDQEEVCDKEEHEEEGHERYHIHSISLSFRVYCVPTLTEDDNSEGHTNAEQIKDKQQGEGEIENNKKGSRNPSRRRGRMGKGIKDLFSRG